MLMKVNGLWFFKLYKRISIFVIAVVGTVVKETYFGSNCAKGRSDLTPSRARWDRLAVFAPNDVVLDDFNHAIRVTKELKIKYK